LAFENNDLPAKLPDKVSHANADTGGFTPLQLEAISGQLRSQPPTAPVKPFTPNEKPTLANLPGIHDNDLHNKSHDGGDVTFDKAGNIVGWESKDKTTHRTYTYHDSAQDRAGLYGIKNESVFQDKNGTFFQYADVDGRKTPTPKLFTRGYNTRGYADLRGAGNSEAMFERAVNKDGSPTVVPISLQQHLKISATLDMVTDNHGHTWQREKPGEPLTEYMKAFNGKKIKTGKRFTDAELLPVDLYVSADRQKLYQNENSPLDSIKPVSIEQTELGDCYWEAPLAEVAIKDPKRLVEMIQDNHDGTYTVKFPLSDPTFASDVAFNNRPTLDVTVEAPTPPEMSTFNLPFDKQQNLGFWSSVYEKAHRYLTGKITEDDGGVGGDSLQLLTGVRKITNFEHSATASNSGQHPFQKQTFTADPRETQDPKLDPQWLTEIRDALEKGEPVVARTPTNGSEWVVIIGGTDDKKVLGQSSEQGQEQAKFHILDRHVYSVVKVEHQEHGQDLITMRNPLANVIPANAKNTVRPFDKNDNGYFQIRPSDFENLFDGVFVN
jgi:hypothetical protein